MFKLIIITYHLCRKSQWFTVKKGPQFSTSTAKPETDLTADMLVSSVCTSYLILLSLSDCNILQWFLEDVCVQEIQFRGGRYTDIWGCISPSVEGSRRNPQHLLGDGVSQ
jgi:hypothetical protein